MAVTATPIFPQAIKNASLSIVNATGTTVTALYVAGTNGSKVESISVASTDTAAQTIQLYATISATNYLIGSITVPIGAGNSGTVPSVNLLNIAQIPGLASDPNGNRYLYLASGTTLSVGMVAAVTAAKAITVFAQVGDF